VRRPSAASAELPALALLALALCAGTWWPLGSTTAPALPDLSAALPARAERPAPPRPGVDPNTADAATLAALPGVGPLLAQRILASRKAQGPFRTPEDLLRVPGLGPARLVGIRPHLIGAGAP